jgi:hypothetical protein
MNCRILQLKNNLLDLDFGMEGRIEAEFTDSLK